MPLIFLFTGPCFGPWGVIALHKSEISRLRSSTGCALSTPSCIEQFPNVIWSYVKEQTVINKYDLIVSDLKNVHTSAMNYGWAFLELELETKTI